MREPYRRTGPTEARLRKGVAWCFRQSGWRYHEIAAYFECSVEWARTMVLTAERRICWRIGIREWPMVLPEMAP